MIPSRRSIQSFILGCAPKTLIDYTGCITNCNTIFALTSPFAFSTTIFNVGIDNYMLLIHTTCREGSNQMKMSEIRDYRLMAHVEVLSFSKGAQGGRE